MKKRLCIRLMAVVTSLVCAFALLSFAQVHAFAEDDAELPYEIRATIITSEKLSNLIIRDMGSNLSFRCSDCTVTTTKLSDTVNQYKLVYRVDNPSDYDIQPAYKNEFRVKTLDGTAIDTQKAKPTVDEQNKVFFNDFTFREHTKLRCPVRLTSESGQGLTIAPPPQGCRVPAWRYASAAKYCERWR